MLFGKILVVFDGFPTIELSHELTDVFQERIQVSEVLAEGVS